MKKLFLIVLIIYCSSTYAQSEDSLVSNLELIENFKINNYTLINKTNDFTNKLYSFSIYNKTTGLNDEYTLTKGNYQFNKSILIQENNLKGLKRA